MEDRMHGLVDYAAHGCASTSDLLDAAAALLPSGSKGDGGGTGGLTCPVCESPPLQPSTLPCGHTVCRCCVVGGAGCPRCGAPVPSTGVATNVLAQALIERWWPAKMNAARSREAAVDLLRSGRFVAALERLDEAVAIDPTNYVLRVKRSKAFSWLGRHQEALHDADQAIKLKPTSSKGYYRRGTALAALNHPEDALVAFCICTALDRNPNAVRMEVARVLQQLAMQAARSPKANRRCGPSCPSTTKWRSQRCPPPQSSDSDKKDTLAQHHDNRRNQRTTCSISANQLAIREACVFTALLERVLQQTGKLINGAEVNGNLSETEGCELKIDPQLVDASDFDCVLCGRILWRPVTTPCGHTYCCMCLDRCLDYSSSCPLCMTSLADYLSTSPKSVSDWIERAIRLAIPQEWASRQAAESAEATAAPSAGGAAGGPNVGQGTATNPPPPSESTISPTVIPVFVCTTAFPGVPCPLFVYEPRYRLMIRRCIQTGTRRFGIAACVPRGSSRFADYGTLLEIRDCVRLSDGCSLLSTVGSARFRVLQRAERDGYESALVQIVRDSPPTATALPALRELHDSVRAKSGAWLNAMSTELRAEVERSFGPMPPVEDSEDWASTPDGPAWTWYLLAVLPLGPQLQVGILSTTSLEKRLLAINKALDHLTGSARTSRSRPTEESRHVYHQHSRSNLHNTTPIPAATSSTSL